MLYTSFTSESVCAGHPDKICDQISDAILDAVLEKDPKGRVAVETLVTENRVVLAGEVSTKAKLNFEDITRAQIKRLGYTNNQDKFSSNSPISIYIQEQSPEIAQGVDIQGAGDQGMMFGFACSETPELMPLPISLAHRLAEAIDTNRETKKLPYLKPDGKTQVTVAYKNGEIEKVTSVVLAVPHTKDVELEKVKHNLYQTIVLPVLQKYALTIDQTDLVVNGTGVWHFGGPAADTGLTGRKIIVDTYGGYARVGGGAFSGKDPTKVDRSGAYAARFLAKNLVANNLADKAEVRLAYFIGAKKPLMQEVETFGTAKVSSNVLNDALKKLLDTSVKGILEGLDLQRPIYLPTAAYGHFGQEQYPWEKVIIL